MKSLKKPQKRKINNILIILLFLASTTSLFSQTEIYIGIEKKTTQNKPKLAIMKVFPSSNTQENNHIATHIKEIITRDLIFSDYFTIVEIEEKIEDEIGFIKNYSDLYSFFLSIEVEKIHQILHAKVDIYNTIKKIKTTKNYTFPLTHLRRAAHIMSDDIIENTVEKKGIASSRIVFSNNSTGFKEIYMIDYDGENLTQLTNDRSISIIPKWSNDGKKIYYTTYKYGNPDIAVINLEEMTTKIFSRFQGLNIPGGFSPDESKFVVILSRGKDPSLYILDLEKKDVKKILDNFGVCSSPTFSPDGKEIAFVSDRNGKPQLYIYNIETKKTRRITNFYWVDSPSWSGDGRWIVFSAREKPKEKLNIFITDPTTSFIEKLTRDEGDNEDPTFSPDSRYIAFISTRNGSRQLFIMDRDGSRPHPLNPAIKGNCYTPHWSKD